MLEMLAGEFCCLLNNVAATLFEKCDYTTWRTPIEIRILWHVDTACCFFNILIVAEMSRHTCRQMIRNLDTVMIM